MCIMFKYPNGIYYHSWYIYIYNLHNLYFKTIPLWHVVVETNKTKNTKQLEIDLDNMSHGIATYIKFTKGSKIYISSVP